jgi:hypothetical protein
VSGLISFLLGNSITALSDLKEGSYRNLLALGNIPALATFHYSKV